jgi:ubiquinone/menaquinone biosynthesis C-methylase UbiE/pimeloyl-ACP methyl ester carboxylesterase
VLRLHHVDPTSKRPLLLNIQLDGRLYFLGLSAFVEIGSDVVRTPWPSSIYRLDRRERARKAPAEDGSPTRVLVQDDANQWREAKVEDYSPVGLRIDSARPIPASHDQAIRLQFLDGSLAGEERRGWVRYSSAPKPAGNSTLGVSLIEGSEQSRIEVDHRSHLAESSRRGQLRLAARVVRAGAALASERWLGRLGWSAKAHPVVRTVDYPNANGERVRAIVDACGVTRGALAIVIPPAWGRTKETLLPLAATLVATCRAAGESVVVLRFDGTRRRGESFTDPDCRDPGRESERFTISGAVADILGSLDFLEHSPEFQTRRIVLITFSAASIEGRRAIVEDRGRRICGWVSVVGTPDLQSGTRTVSGGVDYFGGAERGARFGLQEILGVRVDIDVLAEDALRNRLAFLDDARRDMSQIRIPVTWIHGRDDAWLDLERVRNVMSCGDISSRRLISVPAGHQLRDSRQALEVFQLVACAAFEAGMERSCRAVTPNLVALGRQRRAERARGPKSRVDLRAFWRSYLLGRSGHLGIELMTATAPYRALMTKQIEYLALFRGARVADFGAGTGPLASQLGTRRDVAAPVQIDMLDFVAEAMLRARSRLVGPGRGKRMVVRPIAANLGEGRTVPLADASYDRVLASLLLSYLSQPEKLLDEAFRVLRPGGILVASSLRVDADISKIFIESVEELRRGVRAQELEGQTPASIIAGARQFLNDAARVLALEEAGEFRFWEPSEFESLIRGAGFTIISSELSFGAPPQAVVLAARRPD